MSDTTSLRDEGFAPHFYVRDWRARADHCANDGDAWGARLFRLCADELDAALARSEAQGEWVPVLREFRDRYAGQVDNRGEYPDDLHNRAIAMLAAAPPPPADRAPCQNCGSLIALGAHDAKGACGAPADRAPGEVEAKALAGGLESIVGKTSNINDNWILREAAALIRRLAARAPSAQGDAVAWQRKHEFGNWHDVSREVYELAQREPALRRGYEFRALYTSAPAAGDGDAKAAKLTAGLRAAFAAMQSSYHDDRRILFHELGAVMDLANELRFKLSPPPALAHPTAGEQQGEERHG